MPISAEILANIEIQRKLFDALDTDKKGYLTPFDVLRGIHFLGADDSALWTKAFEEADEDKDENLTFPEFVNLTARVLAARSSEAKETSEYPYFGLFVGDHEHEVKRTPIIVNASDAPPILLVPGLSGSAIVNPATGKSLWLNALIIGVLENYLAGKYDPDTKTVDGVISPVTVVEGPDGVTAINGYMRNLIDSLTGSGIRVGVATYDWRLVPQKSNLDAWVDRVKKEVAKLQEGAKNKQKVFIMGHSMGNLMTMHLFHEHRAWADENIGGYVAVAPPFGGAGLSVHALLTAVYFVPLVPIKAIMLRTLPSISWLFPFQDAIPEAVVIYKGTSFTPSQIPDFLQVLANDFDHESAQNVYPIYEHIVKPHRDYLRTPPPVPVWLVNARFERTQIGINYTNSFVFSKIEESGANVGDGVVPYASLHANDIHWNLPAERNIEIPTTDPIVPVNHNSIPDHPNFILKLLEILQRASK